MAISDRIVPDNPANNFATLNPLDPTDGSPTFLDGNLSFSAGTTYQHANANFFVTQGKWYFEMHVTTELSSQKIAMLGFREKIHTNEFYYRSDGLMYDGTNNNDSNRAYNSGTNRDVIGCYLNLDDNNGEITFYKNGSVINGTPFATNILSNLTNKGFFPLIIFYDATGYANFGQDSSFGGNKNGSANAADANGIGSFYYQPPTGALALCTQNIPEPAVSIAQSDSPNKHFIALRWGIYSSTASIPDNYTVDEDNDGNSARNTIAFNPDLVWVKSMANAHNHVLFDSVRGFGKNILYTNSTSAEGTDENGHVSSVTNNKVNFASGSSGRTNWTSSGHYIGWFWRAGGAPASDGVAMVNGTATTTAALKTSAGATITPTRMSVNTTAGFSIIKWVGNNTNNASIPHGLSKTPDFVLLKNTSDAVNWGVKLNPNTISAVSNEQQYLYFNLTNPFGTNTGEETQLTSSIIKFVGTNLNFSNGSGDNMIAYCWHSVPGYSAFGSYTGNGSTDGPFIYTGFRPAWVMIKNTSNGGDYSSWMIVDSTRSAFNTSGGGNCLWANRNIQEGYRGNGTTSVGANTWLDVDLLSNGIKIRGSGNNTENNDNTAVYIYMAFASQSINFSSAR